jgi:hypothetical protein
MESRAPYRKEKEEQSRGSNHRAKWRLVHAMSPGAQAPKVSAGHQPLLTWRELEMPTKSFFRALGVTFSQCLPAPSSYLLTLEQIKSCHGLIRGRDVRFVRVIPCCRNGLPCFWGSSKASSRSIGPSRLKWTEKLRKQSVNPLSRVTRGYFNP